MSEGPLVSDDAEKTAAVLAALERTPHTDCRGCGKRACGHELVISMALGFKDAPRCAGCLADGLNQPRTVFLEQMLEYVQRRGCWRAGWDWSSGNERAGEGERPSCLWPDGRVQGGGPAAEAPDEGSSGAVTAAAEWDAGAMSCGDLVLQLRKRLRALESGQVLLVTALDPGAPEDLPSWCRLTGNALVTAAPPRYWIQAK